MRADFEQRVRRIVDDHREDRGSLLEILHDVQADLGCIDREAVALIAAELNLSRAEVHGVVTFYRDFRTVPAGRVEIQVCRAEACQAVGGTRLAEHACRSLGLGLGETAADGSVTLDEVFCLGNCALGPSVMIDHRLLGRVDPFSFDIAVAQALS